MQFGIGEIAALITACSWAGSCQVHTMAGRIAGSFNVTVGRVPLFITAMGLTVLATGVNTTTPESAVIFLSLSAFMGLAVSDPVLYFAAVTIGPRLAILIQSLSACITAIGGYLFLGENIGWMGTAGIVTATSGVAFVVMEGGVQTNSEMSSLTQSQKLTGIGAALLAAVTLAFSFLLLKMALRTEIAPVWAAFLRIAMGGCIIWCIAMMRGHLLQTLRIIWTSPSMIKLLVVACAISTIGNTLSPVAMRYTETGIAATLIGLQPIVIIPIIAAMERKLPSVRAVIGTLIACTGTAMIFFR